MNFPEEINKAKSAKDLYVLFSHYRGQIIKYQEFYNLEQVILFIADLYDTMNLFAHKFDELPLDNKIMDDASEIYLELFRLGEKLKKRCGLK
jgi:hypothetical protein